MNSRFTALRVIGSLLKVLAWIDLILGVLSAALVLILGLTVRLPALVDLDASGTLVGIAGFIVILIVAVILFLFAYAAGESIYVFLSIEENSRRTAYFSQEQFRAVAAYAPSPPIHQVPDYGDEGVD